MTSPSSTMSPTGLCLRGGPGGVAIGNPHYLYGRPLNMVTGGQGSGQLNMTGRLTGSEISSSCPSSTIKTNLPLPIHSDETITGTETGAETSEESHNGLPLLGMFEVSGNLLNGGSKLLFLCRIDVCIHQHEFFT